MREELIFLICILSIMDLVTSYIGLQNPGVLELNRPLNWLMNKIGVLPALLVTKIIFLAIVIFCITYPPILILINIMLGIVVINNFIVLFKIDSQGN